MINDLILFGIVIAWSIEKIITKRLLHDNDSKTFNEWSFIIDFLLILPFFLLIDMIDINFIAVLLVLSLLSVISSRLLLKGVKKDNASRVLPFSQFSIFFAIILSIIFLDENPSIINTVGIFLMVTSGFLLSMEKGFKDIRTYFKDNYAIILVLISAFISSINILVNKVILIYASALTLLFFRRMFSFIWVSPTLLKKTRVEGKIPFLASRILSNGGLILFFYVLSSQSVYSTVPILSLQPLLVLLLSHRLLEEKKHFKLRLVSILILMIGYILLKI